MLRRPAKSIAPWILGLVAIVATCVFAAETTEPAPEFQEKTTYPHRALVAEQCGIC